MKIGFDAIWRSFDCFHMVLGCFSEFGLGPHRDVFADGVFEIGVEPLVGVQLGRVAREIEHVDRLAAFCEPRLDDLRMMDAQIVEDEKEFRARMLDQRLEKTRSASGR